MATTSPSHQDLDLIPMAKDILQIVKGLNITFVEKPSQKQPPKEINVSEGKKLVDTEVQELLRKRAITPAQGSKDDEYG